MSFDWASRIAGSECQNNARYIEAGTYLLTIDNCMNKANRNGDPRFIVEATVLNSTNPDFPRTSAVSWVVKLNSDLGPRTVKTFLRDVIGCPEGSITPDVIRESMEPNEETGVSPLAGTQAIAFAREKPTKAGGTFTKVEWRRYNEGDPLPDFAVARQSVPVAAEDESYADTDGDPIPF